MGCKESPPQGAVRMGVKAHEPSEKSKERERDFNVEAWKLSQGEQAFQPELVVIVLQEKYI